MTITMEEKQRLRAGGTNGSGGPAGTAGILELADDVMVCILQHVEDGKTLLVVIPSVGEPGQPGPDGFYCSPRGQRQRHGSIRVPAAARLEPSK